MKTIEMNAQTEKVKSATITILKIAIAILMIIWNLNAVAQDTIVKKDYSKIIDNTNLINNKYVEQTNPKVERQMFTIRKEKYAYVKLFGNVYLFENK